MIVTCVAMSRSSNINRKSFPTKQTKNKLFIAVCVFKIAIILRWKKTSTNEQKFSTVKEKLINDPKLSNYCLIWVLLLSRISRYQFVKLFLFNLFLVIISI